MAACRESVQSPFYRPHSPLVPPQPGPFRISLNQRRPGVSTDRPAIQATGTADTSRKVQHAATACRPDVPENLPAAINAPRPSVPKTIQPPIATPHANGDRTVPPAPAYAPHPAIPRKPFPEATAPSPFAPISQVSIENSTPAHGPQKVNEPVTPTSHLEPEKSKCADHMKDESDKIPPLSYRNMPQRVLRPELKRRGLLSGGPNPELVKRLEQDDAFQATQRTAENYDTMDPKDVHRLCAARLIPSNGTTSLLRDRLKAHDKRGKKKEPAVPIPISIMSHSGHLPVLETKASRKMLDEKPLVPTTKDERALRTKTAERIDKACEGCQKRKVCSVFTI